MKTILAALVAAPILLTGVASAERTLSEGQYMRANQCVTYASLPALKDNAVDLTTVRAQIAASRASQSATTHLSLKSLARDAHNRSDAATTPQAVDDLLARRDRFCASFVDATQLAARAGTTSQQ
jgi:hypothetical protein